MTAEKIAHSNATTGIRKATPPETAGSREKTSDVFSAHLDNKLGKLAPGAVKTNAGDHLDTHLETSKDKRSEKQDTSKSSQKDEETRQAKQTAAERQEQQRLEEQKQQEQLNEKKQEEKKLDEQRKQAEIQDRLNQAKSDDLANKPATDLKDASETTELQTEKTTGTEAASQNDDENSQTSKEESKHTENLDTSKDTGLNTDPGINELTEDNADQYTLIEGKTAEDLTGAIDQHTDTDDQTDLAALQAAAVAQPLDGTDRSNAQKQQADPFAVTSKATQPLESNLGQPDHGEKGDQKGQNGEKDLNQLANGQKTNTNTKDTAQFQPPQNQGQHAPILSNTQLSDAAFKGQLAKAATATGLETSQLQTLDKADAATSISTSLDGKSTSPASQLHARGYASPTQAVAIQIASKAQNGTQQFEIRLNPPELGRVEVKMEFGKDGQINTHLIVERPETLDMLSKDARQLERALSQAGINIENDGITFSLKDQGESGQQQTGENARENGLEGENNLKGNDDPEQNLEHNNAIYRQLNNISGVDISV